MAYSRGPLFYSHHDPNSPNDPAYQEHPRLDPDDTGAGLVQLAGNVTSLLHPDIETTDWARQSSVIETLKWNIAQFFFFFFSSFSPLFFLAQFGMRCAGCRNCTGAPADGSNHAGLLQFKREHRQFSFFFSVAVLGCRLGQAETSAWADTGDYFTATETIRLLSVRTDSPGRPPRFTQLLNYVPKHGA